MLSPLLFLYLEYLGRGQKECSLTWAKTDLLNDEPTDSEEIMVTQSRVSSIPSLGLDRFTHCTRICFRQNQIQEIEGLACLAATLQDLDLYDNVITHMRGLDELTDLTNLDLSFNKIRHIKHVGHLKALKELFLVANKISTIENLEGLEKLTSLELGSNRIREIQGLDSLKALEDLWLAKNKITTLSGLGGLPNLRLLSIQSNRIRDLSPLADVPSLEELYISHNALTTLRGLESCTKLRILEVSNNQITSLEGLTGLLELEEVWASYNQLADFNDVERELKDKKKLTTVYFEGNPLQLRGPALYRNKVKLALPQVVQIDASEFPKGLSLFIAKKSNLFFLAFVKAT
jgi:protein phosphatase 1 regulatory subunit 7